ncbi:uncharacterized protein LOC113339240 [Papaver somniferum]|uniref:uncharacterized protein LOC113339240 n=1 Tax=Papaver somniferum TaxID=3469 RepID=UPI000E6F6201|nr:uncharacterized protein LOC113339240 [Papaver somniferum]
MANVCVLFGFANALVSQGGDSGGSTPVLYISREEGVGKIDNRADRMGMRIRTEDLLLYSSTYIEDILDKSRLLSPRGLIVDSIKTMYLKGVPGSTWRIMHVNEFMSTLLRYTKSIDVPVFLIGNVTKTAGLVIDVIVNESRTLLVEIQELCTPGMPVSWNVILQRGFNMITRVLMKQACMNLQDNVTFL